MVSLGDRVLTALRRVVLWRRRRRLDDELRDEVALHLELRRQALIETGMDPGEATTQAQRIFGNAMAIREETRDMWGFPSIDTLAQDIRYAWRGLRASPAFVATTVLTLAVGLSIVTIAFTIFNAYVLRPFAVRDPGSLHVLVWHARNGGGEGFRDAIAGDVGGGGSRGE
jgi:hypothetical protein